MSLESNKSLIRSWIETGLNTGDWDLIERCLLPTYVFPGIRGLTALRTSLTKMRTGFPDLRVQIDDLLAEDQRVVAQLTYQGTHVGVFFQQPASGRFLAWSGVAIYRIDHGKIAEEWAIWDQTFPMKLSGQI